MLERIALKSLFFRRMTFLLRSEHITSWWRVQILTISLLLATCLLSVQRCAAQDNNEEKTSSEPTTRPGESVELLADDLASKWELFSSREGVRIRDVWKIVKVNEERQLVCLGTPKGFLSTKQTFDNFELSFEWMYPSDANGNSGVLIYTKHEPRLWPTSMQVQLHQPQSGALFATGDAVSNKPFDAGLAGKVGEWNKCKIRSLNGRLAVEINGQKAGQLEGCRPSAGRIAIQSEGSETHFRRLRLKTLIIVKAEDEKTASTDKVPTKPEKPEDS